MTFSRHILFFFTAILALTIASCRSDEPTEAIELYDVVSLESVTSSGSRFLLYKPDSDEAVTLFSSAKIPQDAVKPGESLIIRYIPSMGQSYTSGNINLLAYGLVVNGLMEEDDVQNIDRWDMDPVWLMSVWRGGSHLNFRLRLPYDNRARSFGLVMDTASPDPTHPDVYLMHALESQIDTFNRQYYASFDISRLTLDPQITGFTLHLRNSNLPIDCISFSL